MKTVVLIVSSLSCCGDLGDDTYIVGADDKEESQQGIYFEEKVISAHLVIVCPNTHIHESNLSQMLYFSNKDILNNLETNHIQNVLIIIILYNGSTFISSVFRNFTLNNRSIIIII